MTTKVKAQRQNTNWLNERCKYVLKKTRKDSKRKRKRDDNIDEMNKKEMNMREKEDWNDFINDSINDFEWVNNSVAV